MQNDVKVEDHTNVKGQEEKKDGGWDGESLIGSRVSGDNINTSSPLQEPRHMATSTGLPAKAPRICSCADYDPQRDGPSGQPMTPEKGDDVVCRTGPVLAMDRRFPAASQIQGPRCPSVHGSLIFYRILDGAFALCDVSPPLACPCFPWQIVDLVAAPRPKARDNGSW
jgi:hypothetical protein